MFHILELLCMDWYGVVRTASRPAFGLYPLARISSSLETVSVGQKSSTGLNIKQKAGSVCGTVHVLRHIVQLLVHDLIELLVVRWPRGKPRFLKWMIEKSSSSGPTD